LGSRRGEVKLVSQHKGQCGFLVGGGGGLKRAGNEVIRVLGGLWREPGSALSGKLKGKGTKEAFLNDMGEKKGGRKKAPLLIKGERE